MSGSRFVNVLFALGFIGLGIFASIFLYRDYQHLDHLRSREETISTRLDTLQAQVDQREDQVRKLKQEPEYMERVVRERLNYSKDNEIIFRFE